LAVFINGDFWHGWRFSQWKNKLPKKYWREKIRANRLRDQRIVRALRRGGWKTLVVWEHQLKADPERAISEIKEFIAQSKD
jgi:DNA mismatch endonuclease (patch repair protein)